MLARKIRILNWTICGIALLAIPEVSIAQFTNPIKAAKDAYNKAKQEQQQQQKQTTQSKQTAPATAAKQEAKASPANAGVGPVKAASLDPKSMPDVIGIHLGDSFTQAMATVRAAYPGQRIDVNTDNYPGMSTPVTLGFTVQIPGRNPEAVYVDVLPPPNDPIVWRIARKVNPAQQPIGRATLLAALRDKYHAESRAYASNQGSNVIPAAKNDDEIEHIYWAFDTQGKNVPMPDGAMEQQKCQGGFLNPSPTAPDWYSEEGRSEDIKDPLDPRASRNLWCASAGRLLSVQLSNVGYTDTKFIVAAYTILMDLPTAIQGEKATTAWWRETVARIRQEQIQKANQVKPKL